MQQKKKNIKIAEEKLLGIQNKQKEPLTTKELLNDTAVLSVLHFQLYAIY